MYYYFIQLFGVRFGFFVGYFFTMMPFKLWFDKWFSQDKKDSRYHQNNLYSM